MVVFFLGEPKLQPYLETWIKRPKVDSKTKTQHQNCLKLLLDSDYFLFHQLQAFSEVQVKTKPFQQGLILEKDFAQRPV